MHSLRVGDTGEMHSERGIHSDCEGAGEMFRVNAKAEDSPEPDREEFFGEPAYLTVSGQLQGGALIWFGPTHSE